MRTILLTLFLLSLLPQAGWAQTLEAAAQQAVESLTEELTVTPLEVEIAAGLGAPTLDSDDMGRSLFHVLGPLGGGDDHAGGVVGLQAAVQQMRHGPDNPAGVHHVLHGDALFHHGLGVVAGMVAVSHLDVG